MEVQICPSCQASLDDDLFASTGAAECPFCGADLSDLPTKLETSGVDDAPSTRPTGLPASSKIEVVESSQSRKVILVPAGGKGVRAIGFFALMWNGFMVVFTPGWFLADAGGNDVPMLFIVPFLGLFWAVGLGILYWWVRMRFTRMFLLLEKDRLAIQRILFGRKSIKETQFGPESRAELVESYRENDRPVYAVAINGTNRTAKFGTVLSREEKDWFVREINDFLGVIRQPNSLTEGKATCHSCGATIEPEWLISTDDEPHCHKCQAVLSPETINTVESEDQADENVVAISPDSLPPESEIAVSESSYERLRFSFQAVPRGTVRSVVGGGLIVFSLLWFTITISLFVAGLFGNPVLPGIGGPVAVMLCFPEIIPILLGLFVLRGRITIEMTPDWFSCRWHFGIFGLKKRVPSVSITRITIASTVISSQTGTPRKKQGQIKTCVLHAAGKTIPLTTFHEVGVAREVAGIIRHQLNRMGLKLQDA